LEDAGAEAAVAGVGLKLGAGIGGCEFLCFRGEGVAIEDRTVKGVSAVSEGASAFFGVVTGTSSSNARFWEIETETGCGWASISMTVGSGGNWRVQNNTASIGYGGKWEVVVGERAAGGEATRRVRGWRRVVAGPCI
jgi:hypothetical protein